jgi:hypothetical protein
MLAKANNTRHKTIKGVRLPIQPHLPFPIISYIMHLDIESVHLVMGDNFIVIVHPSKRANGWKFDTMCLDLRSVFQTET